MFVFAWQFASGAGGVSFSSLLMITQTNCCSLIGDKQPGQQQAVIKLCYVSVWFCPPSFWVLSGNM